MYFVYLPEYSRYNSKKNNNDNFRSYKKVIEIVKSYDIPIIDINKEIQRLDKQIQDMKGRLSSVNNKLKNKNFVDRAPEDVITHERIKQKNYESDLSKLEKNMEALQTKK